MNSHGNCLHDKKKTLQTFFCKRNQDLNDTNSYLFSILERFFSDNFKSFINFRCYSFQHFCYLFPFKTDTQRSFFLVDQSRSISDFFSSSKCSLLKVFNLQWKVSHSNFKLEKHTLFRNSAILNCNTFQNTKYKIKFSLFSRKWPQLRTQTCSFNITTPWECHRN